MKMTFGLREVVVSLALVATSVPSSAADKVRVGMIGSMSDAPIFLALDRGYFAKEGIELDMEPMGSLAKQIAPLSSGDLDVACGAISAALYNAVDRKIPLKVVADKGQNAAGYHYNWIIIRKDLADSGAVKSIKDLKGRSLATIGVGSADMSILEEAMKSAGLSYSDLKHSALTLPNHMIALKNKGIDATLTPEPMATLIVEKGIGVKLASVDEFYPGQQQTVIVYSYKFINERPDVAKRFMVAYLRGVRAYMDAVKDGSLSGKGVDEVVGLVVKYSKVKSADLVKRASQVFVDPNGKVNFKSMKKDWEFLKSKGLVKNSVTPEDIVDMSYVDAAVKKLGPYKKP